MSQKSFIKWRQHFLIYVNNFFYQKAQNIVYFVPHGFVQISPACNPNTYQNVWRDFRPPMSVSVTVNRKLNRKLNFCGKFAIKTFLCYRCKYWHWNSKVSPYIIWYVLGSHASEIWTKSYCLKCTKFWVFWQKIEAFKTIYDKNIDAILKDVPIAETSV